MKPIIKWVGGKRRFLSEINSHISNYENYYEPFAGSAALFFMLENDGKSYINDLNENLINFYKTIKNSDSEIFHKDITKMIEKNKSKESYYKIRSKYNYENSLVKNNNGKLSYENSIMFFYLNKMSFNGIYRVNSNGEFNTPRGSSDTPYIPTVTEIEDVKKLFSKTKITSLNWMEVTKNVQKGDLVYLDPPYYPDSTSKFVGYTDPRFGEEQHDELIEEVARMEKVGAKILISNSNSTEFFNKINSKIEKVKYIEISTRRSINPLAENKDRFKEALYIVGEKE